MDGVSITAIIGITSGVGSFIIAYFVYCRTKAKDNKSDGASIATITSDTGYIKSSIDGINTKLEKQDERHGIVIERLCHVESSASSAHKRIDDIVDKEK